MSSNQAFSVGDPFLIGSAYSIPETARLAKTTAATVRRWLVGYDAPGHHMEPVFGEIHQGEAGTPLQVSFLQLVEIAIAVQFRRVDGVSLERVRRAHSYARKVWLVPFPFATMKFKVSGGHLMHQFEETEPGSGHLAFDLDGQWALPEFVFDELNTVDFEATGEYASRWYPYGRQAHIVIDPHFVAGRPIIEGTRIPVRAVKERFDAGESIRYLARDYGLSISTVEEVIRLAA